MAQDAAQLLDTLSTQLKFLSDAAHLMAVNAPACSSHIMSTCDGIMFANEMEPSEAHRRHSCGGCGTIKIPAWTVDVEKESGNGSRKTKMTKGQLQKLKERTTKSASAAAMVDICKLCHRKTRQSILKTAPQRSARSHAPVSRPSLTASAIPVTSSLLIPSATLPPASINANSKKRAKSRKQGGLQALLAKNKEAQCSRGFGLDLMDLMK